MEKIPVCDVNIPENMPDFNSQGNVGSWRQVLAENIGKQVKLEISLSIDGQLRVVCGEIYFVGAQYVALISNGKVILSDILGIKFITFCCQS